MNPRSEPLAKGNIQLDYRLSVLRTLPGGDDVVLHADGAEVFMDEHGIQWIKFFPKNGYDAGKEHVVRTDSSGFTIVRTS
jgi:hypothetical protein